MNALMKHRLNSRGVMLLLVLLTWTSSGCLCAFHQDWQAAKACPSSVDPLAGRWEGTWVSHTNGHNGKIRAVFKYCGNGKYKAHYQGNFHVILPFVYKTTHQITGTEPGSVHFTAREDLGPLLGTFTMNGCANGQSFVAHYRSADDRGEFKMTRVGSCGCCSQGCTSCASTSCTATGGCTTETPVCKPYDDCE